MGTYTIVHTIPTKEEIELFTGQSPDSIENAVQLWKEDLEHFFTEFVKEAKVENGTLHKIDIEKVVNKGVAKMRVHIEYTTQDNTPEHEIRKEIKTIYQKHKTGDYPSGGFSNQK